MLVWMGQAPQAGWTGCVAPCPPSLNYRLPHLPEPLARAMSRYVLALFLIAVTATGCNTAVGVRESGFQPVYRDLRSNVLDKGHLSKGSRDVLAYFGLDRRYAIDAAAVIAELEATNRRERVRSLQVALAEMSYDLALVGRDRGRFLAAAVHAYLYLFGEGLSGEPAPYSARFRLACDLYNRGLAMAMRNPDGAVTLADGDVATPSGNVSIHATRPGFPWGDEEFNVFLPSDAYQIVGLRERVRTYGLGIPLVAIQAPGSALGLSPEQIGRSIHLPATAFLRLEGGLKEFAEGRMSGSLELYLGVDSPTVSVGSRQAPLAVDLTAPLAHTLEESGIANFSIRGFRKGSTDDFKSGVFMLQPYQQGKIPLLLVHGTASSPATWAQTVNGILADARLRGRYQVWLALYNTGNPVTYSAAVVREKLSELHDTLARNNEDPALSQMVIVGHSQGGLLTRLLLSESGDRFWESISDQPFDSLDLEPESRDLLSKACFFDPVPFATRGVFISTPHRGSYVAGGWLGGLANRFVELPGRLTTLAKDLVSSRGLPPELADLPTSVDNMDPDNRFTRTLAELPFGKGVRLHSIIAVKPGEGAIETGKDGVVKYTSAHLDNVESEFVVRHGHSCQGQPETITELRRILFEHLGSPQL